MQLHTFSDGVSMRMLVVLLCAWCVIANSQHGYMHHPRQLGRGGGGGGGRGGGGGGGGGRGRAGPPARYGGNYRQTWFAQLPTRFDDVAVDNNNKGIDTDDFLDAASSLPSFLNLLGQVGFYPARTDSNANIQKIRNRYNAAQGDSGTLQSLVRKEKNDRVSYSGSAAEALLWLTRTLDFTAQALRRDLNDNKNVSPDDPNPKKPLSEAFQKTYPGTLQQYHNTLQRTLFSGAWTLVPRRAAFYQSLAGDETSQIAVEDTEKWVAALENIVNILKDFMNSPDSRW